MKREGSNIVKRRHGQQISSKGKLKNKNKVSKSSKIKAKNAEKLLSESSIEAITQELSTFQEQQKQSTAKPESASRALDFEAIKQGLKLDKEREEKLKIVNDDLVKQLEIMEGVTL